MDQVSEILQALEGTIPEGEEPFMIEEPLRDVNSRLGIFRSSFSDKTACVFNGRLFMVFGDASMEESYVHEIKPDQANRAAGILEKKGLGDLARLFREKIVNKLNTDI